MTPFGEKIRELRNDRGMTQAFMADHLGVSAAYLSALERGKRGKPSWALVQSLIELFELIWDDADELGNLARVSHPRIVVDTANLTPKATETANKMAKNVGRLTDDQLDEVMEILNNPGKVKKKYRHQDQEGLKS